MRVDGVEEYFSNRYYGEDREPHKHTSFWGSGGGCGFNDDYTDSYVDKAPWIIRKDSLPEHLKPFADEISELFNDNVPYGCCGGCL